MKVVEATTLQYTYLIRHWFRWYLILPDGGLVKVNKEWFKEADNK